MAHDIKEFLEHAVDNYLVGDLNRLKAGRIGYPLMMTAFAGIELLGALLSEDRFEAFEGHKRFRWYWSQYLYGDIANSENVGNALYQLARHGIAHSFVLKGSVVVDFDVAKRHLKRSEDDLVYVNPRMLADDLIRSYEMRVKPLLQQKVIVDRMTSRLNEMDNEYKRQAVAMRIDNVFELASAEDARSDSVSPEGPSGPNGGLFGSVDRLDWR